MSIRAQAADGSIHEFPDGTSVDVIDKAMLEYAGAQKKSNPSAANFYGSGLLRGIKDPWDAAAQLLPHGLAYASSLGGTMPNLVSKYFGDQAAQLDSNIKGDEQAYRQERSAQGGDGFDVGRLAGNVISPINLAAGAGMASVLPKAGTLAKVASSALSGAGLGALQPVTDGDFADQKLGQMTVGAIAGPIANAATSLAGKAISPAIGAAQKKLMDMGVSLTPGQILGGLPKKIEDKLTSVPILGDAITSARQSGIKSFNAAAANRALAPVGERVGNVQAGRPLIEHVESVLSDKYDSLLPKLQFKPDQQFVSEMVNIKQMADGLPEAQAARFTKLIGDKLLNKMTPQGNMSGESFKAAESELRRLATGYQTSADFDQRELGSALASVTDSLRETLKRANPQHAGELAKINEGWANYARLRKAAAMQGAEEGMFTPAQLSAAVRAKAGGVDKSQYAKGNALLQDLSDAGKSVLPSKVPDSGTAGRLMLNAGALASGTINPAIPGVLLGGSSLYTKPGLKGMEYLLARRPEFAEPLADLVRKYGQPIGTTALLPALETWQ